MANAETPRLTQRELERALAKADAAVLLASPRILRRVIRVDRRLTTFGWAVPHRKSYVIGRERLFDLVSRFEMELDLERELPETLILLERPDEKDLLQRAPIDLLREYWRLLFHIRVHTELNRRIASGQLSDANIVQRLQRIGSTEYAEIRDVLQREEMLLPPLSDLQIYVEFAAVFLELKYFAPDQLAWWFPGLRDGEPVSGLLGEDVDHAELLEATRLLGVEDQSPRGREGHAPDAVESSAADPLQPSPPAYWRLIARAEKVGSVGNVVKAAILRMKASRQALPDRGPESQRLASAELDRLARRLQPVLELSDEETRAWSEALAALLKHVDQGFRAVEARLLYDLQKVCVEHEQGVFKLDLLAWLSSIGRIPIRRPLPLLRQVLVTKHLQSAARKLASSRLTGDARTALAQLIDAAAQRAKLQLRERLHPQIAAALQGEGMEPANVPERVAIRKIVEELLDRIVDHGHLNFGNLRDTLSQNNLKLPDLTSLWELLSGDLLLRIDRRLAQTLDGVYHRGPIYLRMSQRLSAMAFGTPFGRRLTRYGALPFGGAFLILESIRHVVHLFVRESHSIEIARPSTGATHLHVIKRLMPDTVSVAQILLLGILLMLLIEHAAFREACASALRRFGQFLRRWLFDVPMSIVDWPWVRRLLDSSWYAVLVCYVLKPLLLTAAIMLPIEVSLRAMSWPTWLIFFLVVNLLVNSPLGRYADEVITEQVLRTWRELQMRVFAALIRAVIDAFQWLLQTIERLLYTVDEWLRFRTGESAWTMAIKVVLSVVWSVVNYLVRIYITLLVEPQINPIKHFPVVTVSHKIMLPFSVHLTRLVAAPLSPLGTFWSNAIAGANVFLLPGVFGFLVWELKENWRLYASNRPTQLRPAVIGSHGETMQRYLRLGFHSGTLPRLFGKLRFAARRTERSGPWKTLHRHRDAFEHVQESIRHFIERELLALLAEVSEWKDIPVEVGEVRLATNEVAVSLFRCDVADDPLWLEFRERSGWMIAMISQRGWLANLPNGRQDIMTRALGGLFHSVGVDILWEQLVDEFSCRSLWYDITPEGIAKWTDAERHSAVLLRLSHSELAHPWPLAIQSVVESTAGDRGQFFMRETPLAWQQWVDMWRESPNEMAVTESQFGTTAG